MRTKNRQAALITGGACRIGKAIAIHLASLGYDIALHYHCSLQEAFRTAENIRRKGVSCKLFSGDLNEPQVAASLIRDVSLHYKRLALVINNAAVFLPARLKDTQYALFEKHFNINFKSPFFLTQAFSLKMKRGHVINMIDTRVKGNEG
ncbi:MAG: SDR family NAD(P)-dependent oxidoreductase, partial [Chlamydiota bacterium]|nr:SDR family NAD(P)-dependent oxidoreductase [Chlamydiota bacterium]